MEFCFLLFIFMKYCFFFKVGNDVYSNWIFLGRDDADEDS